MNSDKKKGRKISNSRSVVTCEHNSYRIFVCVRLKFGISYFFFRRPYDDAFFEHRTLVNININTEIVFNELIFDALKL